MQASISFEGPTPAAQMMGKSISLRLGNHVEIAKVVDVGYGDGRFEVMFEVPDHSPIAKALRPAEHEHVYSVMKMECTEPGCTEKITTEELRASIDEAIASRQV